MKKVVFGSILTLFLLGSALQLIRIGVAVTDTRQLDYGEGIILWQASQVFNLKSAFHPLDQYPHIVFHYTPLYHIALRGVTTLVGDPLLSGRLISMAAAFWLIGLFGWVVRRATRGYASDGTRWFGAVFAGAWALLVPSMQWAPLARVDMLGLALQFTALSIICTRRPRLRNQLFAFCLLLLGMYTKQSLLAMPAAAVLLLGLIRPARAVWLTCALASSGLIVLLTLAWVTDGGVIRHWILYNVNPFHLKNALRAESGYARDLLVLIATGLVITWLALPRFNGRPATRKALSARLAASRLRRTGVGFGATAIIGFAISWGIGKEGANINYCLDWQLALCPLTGIFMVLLLKNWQWRDRSMTLLRPLVVVMLMTSGLVLDLRALEDCNDEVGITADARRNIRASRREDVELIRFIAGFPGPVVSENMTALLQAGKTIPFEPAIIQQTTQVGTFDESSLVGKASDRYFDAFIILNIPALHFFSPRMLEAIRQNYDLYPWPGDQYIVYVRRSR